MGNFWGIARKIFIWCWRLFVSIPAVFILIEATKTIASGSTMDTITRIEYYSAILFIVPFVLGIIYLAIFRIPEWVKKRKVKVTTLDKVSPSSSSTENARISVNVNINTGDFTNANMDTERMERVFSNLVDIIKGGDSNTEKQPATEIGAKEAKSKT